MNATHVIQLSPNITNHDISYRLKKCEGWLKNKDRIVINLMFKGRQIVHPEIGFERVNYLLEQLKPFGNIEKYPSLKGKNITAIIGPKGRKG